MKRYLLLIVAGFLHYSGFLRLWMRIRHGRSTGDDICVLGLHRVLSPEEAKLSNSLPGIILSQETFEAVLDHLNRRHSVVPLEFLFSHETPKGSLLPCLLTFDDGWRDNFTTALPLLRKYKLPAVVFAVTGMIGTDQTFWVEMLGRSWQNDEFRHSVLASLDKQGHSCKEGTDFWQVIEVLKHLSAKERKQILDPLLAKAPGQGTSRGGDRMLTWDEAAALEAENFKVEAHTATHPLLVYEDDQRVKQELTDCKKTLEEKLSKRVRAFAYPNGSWDSRVRGLVGEAGYECAFVTNKGWYRRGSDPLAIPRIMLHEGMVVGPSGKFSPALLSLRLSGLI